MADSSYVTPTLTARLPVIRSDLERSMLDVRKGGCWFLVVNVPFPMLEPHRMTAYRNHSQTLEQLASRGGMSACEILAVLEDRRWKRMDPAEAHRQLAERVVAWENRPRPIEEAPQDGTEILLGDTGGWFVGWFSQRVNHWVSEAHRDNDWNYERLEPTVWLPLPVTDAR